MKYAVRLKISLRFLVIVLTLSFISGFTDPKINNQNPFVPDQKTIDYIYNRILDLIIRHPDISGYDGATILFVPMTDTIFINPELNTPETLGSVSDDSLKLIKIECQSYFDRIVFSNTFPITRNAKYVNNTRVNNSNKSITFSTIYKHENKLYVAANIFRFDLARTPPQIRTQVNFEIEICSNANILFRKLYTNVLYGEGVVTDCTKLISNDLVRNIENIPKSETPKGKYTFIDYDEVFDLGDRECGE